MNLILKSEISLLKIDNWATLYQNLTQFSFYLEWDSTPKNFEGT